eukprot:767858-Hanusia_phi.AAC.3
MTGISCNIVVSGYRFHVRVLMISFRSDVQRSTATPKFCLDLVVSNPVVHRFTARLRWRAHFTLQQDTLVFRLREVVNDCCRG